MRDETDDSPGTTRIGRHRAVYLTAAVTGVLALLVGLAVVTRLSTSAPSSTAALSQTRDALRIASLHPVPSSSPSPSSSLAPTPAVTPVSTALSSVPVTATTGSATTSPASDSTVVTGPVTMPRIRLEPAVTASLPQPDVNGPDVLEWTAPFGLEIRAEHTAQLSVTAHNPTDRPARLSHPLSCTPRINEDEICTQNVQLVGPGQSVSATYTIDARGVAPGLYTLRVEGVLTISVTVS